MVLTYKDGKNAKKVKNLNKIIKNIVLTINKAIMS